MDNTTLLIAYAVVVVTFVLVIAGRKRLRQRQHSRSVAPYTERERRRLENNARIFNPQKDIPSGVGHVTLVLRTIEHRDDISKIVALYPGALSFAEHSAIASDWVYDSHDRALWHYTDMNLWIPGGAGEGGVDVRAQRRFDDAVARLEAAGWDVSARLQDDEKSRFYHLARR